MTIADGAFVVHLTPRHEVANQVVHAKNARSCGPFVASRLDALYE
jgi:hypothetical protein